MIGNTYVTPLLSLMAIACSAPALAMSQPSLNSAVARLAAVSCVVRPAPTSTRPKGSVDVGGGRIYYEVLGDGPPLVLIHDGILHSEVWDSQFGVFAERYRVIRYDRRGYGRHRVAGHRLSHPRGGVVGEARCGRGRHRDLCHHHDL